MARGNKRQSKPGIVCIVLVLLIVMPAMGQQEDPAQIRIEAMALEKQGLNAEAEQIWNGIAKADPRDAEALAHLGLLEARQEHLGAAIDYYRRAAAINSDLPGLQMNMGLALFKSDSISGRNRSLLE